MSQREHNDPAGQCPCKEQAVPIIVKHVTLETHLGTSEKTNQLYHNVLVQDLEVVRYVENERKEGNFIRKRPIIRCCDENVFWPDHPLNIGGQIQGAIAIIHSLDDRILLVRNRKLWGLPKGARNYREFIRLKSLTDNHFRKTGDIMEHEKANFTYDDAETPVENLCREVREETGITVDEQDLKPFKYRNQSGSYCAYDGYYYEYPKTSREYIQDLQSRGTDHENDELLWVTHEELTKLLRDHRQNHRITPKTRVFNHVTFGYLEEYMKK
jgi:8-oxo-dGTP pyrophosphatase MutT (NUDIX family)